MKPILFNTEMVKAILDGRKTQTRRKLGKKVVLVDGEYFDFEDTSGKGNHIQINKETIVEVCPYGKVGDRLEVWVEMGEWLKKHFSKEEQARSKIKTIERVDAILEITDIRVERLQEITIQDISREGIPIGRPGLTSKEHFVMLWNSLAKDGFKWNDNPWVWVISFKASGLLK